MKIKKPSFLENFNMRPLKTTEKILLTVLAIVAISWLGNKFVLSPQASKLEETKLVKYELEAEINEMNELFRRESSVKKEWELLKREKNQILSRYFPSLNQAQIIYLLNNLLLQEDVNLADFNFTRPNMESISEMDIYNMELSIPFNGGYDGVLSLIKSVGDTTKRLVVSSLTIDRNPNGSVSGNIDLKAYSFEDNSSSESTTVAIDSAENLNKNSLFSSFTGYKDGDNEQNYDSQGNPIVGSNNGNTGVEPGLTNEDPLVVGDILHNFETKNYDFISSNPLVKGSLSPTTISKSGRFAMRMEYNIIGVEEKNTAMADISSSNITLKYPPTYLNIWVHSFSYGPGKVGIKAITQSGEKIDIPLSEGVSWLGWSNLEVSIPGDVSIYPLKISHVYYELPEGRDDFGVLIFDKLEAFYPHHFEDPVRGKKTSDHLFYEVKAGDSITSISRDVYGSIKYKNEIMKNNDMKAGDLLIPGKILVLVDR